MFKANETQDYSTNNFLALVFSVILLFIYIFLPWYGTKLVDNAASIFANNIYQTPGTPNAPFIWLVGLEFILGTIFSLFGILKPENDRIASILATLSSFLGIGYFVATLTHPEWIPSSETLGSAFWLSLIFSIGLLLHMLIMRLPFGEYIGKIFPKPKRASTRYTPYLFLLPALALYIVWIIAPTIYTFYLSLTKWDAISEPVFIGLANFKRLFTHDKTFIEALINNLRWLVIFITVPTAVGLGLALVFNNERPGSKFFKVSFFLPLVLSLPVIGLIWAWLYNPRLGLINSLLGMIGVENAPGWLGDRELAIWCIIGAAVWRQVGYVMILYLAGLKNIDPTFLDAAQVDGANGWRLFKEIIFPLLAPVTTIVVVISIIDSLRAFDLVSVMTRGGQNSQVLANFMYMEAFNNYRMGYGASIAVVLFAISMIFIIFYLTTVIKDEMQS
ncbi:MAG: sugar ABC transporter permease [Anaerolineaceae bacterium]|nr:sugar ABC transporter permease [Anaerolineaceae bacterium]